MILTADKIVKNDDNATTFLRFASQQLHTFELVIGVKCSHRLVRQ